MVIGAGRIVLRLHGVYSLKEKRKIVKAVIGRIQNSFNASVAEIGANDIHDRAEIGFSLTGSDQRVINAMVDKIFNKVEAMGLAELVDTSFELMVF
ncbi:hypothetical protein SAMN02746065_1294 [Desulfocicer vacuolatum DSM 3385]|uniref:DUF503 domain-containing protein n=1 Tax=Desulfocicer vacuolatum DSM 3385 TaxID=1121400 RepID=A0A1W2ED18_9BACT|nr:DUF503 domain-containing protein [Desulfocicer vacuolatum]SMD07547.1 hypothetical protein SAMN02746065_1294 [Desulfocicer vacuolatum DSM 3385]